MGVHYYDKYEMETQIGVGPNGEPWYRGYTMWEEIPRWHPRRWWQKYDMRRRVRDYIRGGYDWYEYGHYQDIARDRLHELYAPHEEPRRGE